VPDAISATFNRGRSGATGQPRRIGTFRPLLGKHRRTLTIAGFQAAGGTANRAAAVIARSGAVLATVSGV
jgi:hypothetical protein